MYKFQLFTHFTKISRNSVSWFETTCHYYSSLSPKCVHSMPFSFSYSTIEQNNGKDEARIHCLTREENRTCKTAKKKNQQPNVELIHKTHLTSMFYNLTLQFATLDRSL